jgi:hypothetical protein
MSVLDIWYSGGALAHSPSKPSGNFLGHRRRAHFCPKNCEMQCLDTKNNAKRLPQGVATVTENSKTVENLVKFSFA